MSVVKVKPTHFSGTGKVSDRTNSGLGNIIRQMLIQTAQTKAWGASLASFTDNTTGTPATPGQFATIPVPLSPTVPTSTLGEGYSAFNTSLGNIRNATAVMVSTLNVVRQLFSLPLLTYGEGTIASANTLPAQDVTGTGAAVGSTALYSTSVAAMLVAQMNMEKLKLGMNEILTAIGATNVGSSVYGASNLAGGVFPDLPYNDGASTYTTYRTQFQALANIPAATEDTGGVGSILVTDATAFLAAMANDFASLSLIYNDFVPAPRTTAITDSTTGTPSAASPPVLQANAIPAAADGAATTSAPKAGWDTQQGYIRNAISSMSAAYNILVADKGNLAEYVITDSTGGTVSSTLHAMSSTLVAVDGSSGTSALDQASARADMAIIDNSLSSLGYYASELAPLYDVAPLGTDALGGTVSNTLAALSATTAAGVGGATAVTILNSAAEAWLALTMDNISTLAVLLNAMNSAVVTTKPLLVIAG